VTLVSLSDAKTWLHVTDPARDAEVTRVVELASAIIYEYIGTRADPAWDETTAPDPVQAATLKLVAALWEHRGDDEAPAEHDAKLWEAIALLLMRTRDPALA
jgi:hypothetical protein